MSFAGNFKNLVDSVKEIGLKRDDVNEISQWGQLYGHLLYLNQSGIYRDDDFEECLKSKYAITMKSEIDESSCSKEDLHILSEAYSTGGHTRLMEKIVILRGGDLLIVRPCVTTKGVVTLEPTSVIFSSCSGYDIESIVSIASDYKNIFLHIHPDDLKTAVAAGVVQNQFGCNIIFINHADHVFSYGFSSANAVAEVSLYGMALTKQKKGIESAFLGIPLPLKIIPPVKSRESYDALRIMSGGDSIKYKPYMDLSFPLLVKKILERIPSATINVIGPELLKNKWWWLVKLRFWARLEINSKLPYEQYSKIVETADLYIDSLPMTGGTALPEIRSKGIPVTGVLCGSSGYTPADTTKYVTIDTLVDEIEEYYKIQDSNLMKRNSDDKLSQLLLTAHGEKSFVSRLNEIVEGLNTNTPYSNNIPPDISFYQRQWEEDKVLNIDARYYEFIFNEWNRGGRALAATLYKLNPIRFSLKFIKRYIKGFGEISGNKKN